MDNSTMTQQLKNSVEQSKINRNWRQYHTPQEFADVLIYCLSLANAIDTDVATIVNDKIRLNAEKYPIEKARGSNKKYNESEV